MLTASTPVQPTKAISPLDRRVVLMRSEAVPGARGGSSAGNNSDNKPVPMTNADALLNRRGLHAGRPWLRYQT